MQILIDADALKLSHCKECSLYPDKCMGDDCDCGAIIHINAMPTIDAEPVRHGKWIFESICGRAVMTCSECLKVQSGQTLCFTYCPNCGARMDKE